MKKRLNLVLVLWLASLVFYGYRAYLIANAAIEVENAALNPEKVTPLDLFFFGFTTPQVQESFVAMGEKAMQRYRVLEEIEDRIYPISYMLLMVFTIILLARFLGLNTTYAFLACLFPVGAVFADFAENTRIIGLIDSFPNLLDDEVEQTSFYNTLKWSLVSASVICILGLSFSALIKKIRSLGA